MRPILPSPSARIDQPEVRLVQERGDLQAVGVLSRDAHPYIENRLIACGTGNFSSVTRARGTIRSQSVGRFDG
jgi:hypothetical protein